MWSSRPHAVPGAHVVNRVPIVSFDLEFEKVDGAKCKYSCVTKDVSAFDGNEEWLLQSFYRVSCAASTELCPVVSSAWSVRLLEHKSFYWKFLCTTIRRSMNYIGWPGEIALEQHTTSLGKGVRELDLVDVPRLEGRLTTSKCQRRRHCQDSQNDEE